MKIFGRVKFKILVIVMIMIVIAIGSILTIKTQNEKNIADFNTPAIIENKVIFAPQLPVIVENGPSTTVIAAYQDKYYASSQAKAPVLYSIKTSKPVIFLGIDDGIKKSPEALEYFRSKRWPMTMFINQVYYKENIDYFKDIINSGANIGSHTINHLDLTKLNYEQQKKEICNAQDGYLKDFGSKAKFLRPPYGNFNENTEIAAKACGHIAIIHWKARIDEGKVFYQSGNKLNAGDIVLMHFRPRIMEDLKAFDDEITKQGLLVQNMNDWID